MVLRAIRISAVDADWHSRFFSFVGQVFDGLDFSLWAERGGWDSRYEVFAMVEHGRILATVGRSRMDFVINGLNVPGFQLGAVATHVERRLEGLSRRLIECVIDERDDVDQPIILFANDAVLDFYPRFGFKQMRQQRFTTKIALDPACPRARLFAIENSADRARLAHLCARAGATGRAFSARNYSHILLWHLTYRPMQAFWLDAVDGFVVTEATGGRLVVHECIAPRRFDLCAALPRVITEPVSEIEFGFDPTGWLSNCEIAISDDDEALLFMRGDAISPINPFRFPNLAQT
jgi:predicted N-acetyltransferase YhbS